MLRRSRFDHFKREGLFDNESNDGQDDCDIDDDEGRSAGGMIM